jgi:hypothetical protein
VKNKKTTGIYGLFLEDNCLIKTYLNSCYSISKGIWDKLWWKFRWLQKLLQSRTALPMDNGIETSLNQHALPRCWSKVLFFITEIQMLSKHHRLRWSLHAPTRKRGFFVPFNMLNESKGPNKKATVADSHFSLYVRIQNLQE